MEYAVIVKSLVENIIYLHPMHAKNYDNIVPINGLPINIGDEYREGTFYRDGILVTSHPYENEKYGISPEMLSFIKDDAITEVEEAVLNGTDE